MTRMTSFYSQCTYHWFVTVPSTKIGPISPWILTAHHTMHFAGCSDVSMTVWMFRDPGPCVLLVHKPIKVEMGFSIKPQAV